MSNNNKYAAAALEVAELVARKQEAYGDAFTRSGEVLKILYPNGVSVDNYQELLTVTRILDKLFRISTNNDSFNEDPWRDILGYALLAVTKNN
jgi:hypothetical protein